MRLGLPGGPARLGGSKAGLSVVIALGCLLAIAGGAAAAEPGMSNHAEPPPLTAKQGDAVVSATLGSYCWDNSVSVSHAICVDVGYPLRIQKRLAVAPGGKLSLRVGIRAEHVEVSLRHVAGSDIGEVLAKLGSKPVSPSRSSWMTKLPRDLGTGNVLDVSVQYAGDRGNADFWVGLRAK